MGKRPELRALNNELKTNTQLDTKKTPVSQQVKNYLTKSGLKIYFDEFFNQIFVDGEPLTDITVIQIKDSYAIMNGKDVGKVTMLESIQLLATVNKRNWLQDYFNNLPKWDGIDRMPEIAIELTKSDDPLYQIYLMKWLLGSPVRAFEDNEMVKAMIILTGGQNIGKSSFLNALVPPTPRTEFGFNDSINIASIKNKPADFWQSVQGCMICEFAELVGNRREHVDALKNVVSSRAPKMRMPYDRVPSQVKISAILAGTTNDETFLRDVTGNVRFFVLPCKKTKIDIDTIVKNRDQIWAQVYQRFNEGEKHWIHDEEVLEMQRVRNKWFMKLSHNAEILMDTVKERNMEVIALTDPIFDNPHDHEIEAAMKALEWQKVSRLKFKRDGKPIDVPTCWICPELASTKKKSELARAIYQKIHSQPVYITA